MLPDSCRVWFLLVPVFCLFAIAENVAAAADAEELDELLVEYRAGGLPLPPADARLVRFWAGVTSGTRLYHLGFLLKPQNDAQRATILVGTRRWEVERHYERDITFLDPEEAPLDGRNSEWSVTADWYDPEFKMNSLLATAIQCRARGWNQLAERLLARSLKKACGEWRSPFYQHANQPPKTALAEMEWAHWGNELVTPGTDRLPIFRRMKHLVSRHEKLNNEENRALLDSLEAAVTPSGARPRTVESTIDGLAEVAGVTPPVWINFFEADPHYLKVVELGFEAVPALIEHLDDRRLTRSILFNPFGFPSQPLVVGEVAACILEGIGERYFERHAVAGRAEWVIGKADAIEWWNGVKRTGEEQFVVQNVLTREHQSGPPNEYLLCILAKKYPQRLPEVYKTLLDDQPGIYSDEIARLIRRSPVENAVQSELFAYGARHRQLEPRRVALRQLADLDRARFVELLVKTLDELPRSPEDSPPCRTEASFASLVLETDAVEAWSALGRAARRSNTALRMEFLDNIHHKEAGEKQRKQRLTFLAGFLGDSSVRKPSQIPRASDGCCGFAGYGFPALEVRNLAAMSLAPILGIDAQADRRWLAEHWADFRGTVQAALDAEEIPYAK